MKNMKKRNRFLVLLAILSMIRTVLSGAVSEAGALDLRACIELAVRNNPGLASRGFDVAGAKARLDERKGEMLPVISGGAGFTGYSDNVLPGGETRDYRLALQVRQPVYMGGRLAASAASAKSSWKAAGYRYQAGLQDLVLEVTEVYFNYLKNQRLLTVAQRALEQAETYLEAAQERFRLGVARKADTLKAEVEVSDAELEVIKARNVLLTTGGQLNKILGLPVTGAIRVKDVLENREESDEHIPPVESLVKEAELNVPELKEIDMTVRAQRSAIKIAKGEYLPSVSVGASYYWNGGRPSDLERRWDMGLNVDIPIFKGFTRRARVSQQKARLQLISKEQEELRRNVWLAVWTDYLKVKETRERIGNSKKHLKNASENLRIAEGEYKEGVSSMLELIDARTVYIEAEERYIGNLAEYKISRAKLARSIGSIK
jgi:outer membrane protein TolC